MARVSIQTDLKNITDGASSTVSASLDGVPFTTSTIISSRVFTKASNTSYITEPYVSFNKTKTPSDYTYTRTQDNSAGTTTFTVKYRHPLKPPTTDVIEFLGEAKTDLAVSTGKIYSYKIKDERLNPLGETRFLKIYGDPNTALKLDVTKNPRVNPEGDATSIINGEKTVLIGENGSYTTPIIFPSTTLKTSYRVKLTEIEEGSFPLDMASPFTTTIDQFPTCEVRLIISGTIASTGTTALTAPTTLKYFGKTGSTLMTTFKFVATKTVDIEAKGTFEPADFTQTDKTSSTLTDTEDYREGTGLAYGYIPTTVDFSNLSISFNNNLTPNEAVIEGTIRIKFGYNSGGHTAIALGVGDIIQNA